MTETEINQIIAARERLTNRRDEQVDWVAVDHFDAVLSTVPAGVNNTIDKLLGRPGAVLPERVEYQRWSTDEQRAEWKDAGAAQIEQAAQAKQSDHDAYLESISDQYADMLDWHRLCGDLAI